jgi:sec-independent protein translocase protein TatA
MKSIFLIGMPGGSEWIMIAIAVLVLFGAKKIPEFAKGLGRGIREFKDAVKDVKKGVDEGAQSAGKLEEGDK